MRRVFPLTPAFLCLALLALSARAQVVNYTWLTSGVDENFSNPANWQDGQVPLSSPDSRWNFPNLGSYYDQEVIAVPAGTIDLDSMYFDASYPGVNYRFTSTGPATLTFSPDGGSYGQTSSNTGNTRSLVFDANITLNFATDQYWTASNITINGSAGGAGRFRYLPLNYYSTYYYNTGTLTLNGPGNFTGGFETNNVNLYLNHASAVAGGTLYLTDTRIYAAPGYTLDNAMEVAGRFEADKAMSLTGSVALAGDVNLSGNFTISGNISETVESSHLNIVGGTVRLSGTNTYNGGTTIGDTVYFPYPPYSYYVPASAIFENASAVPVNGSISTNLVSYAGAAFTTGLQANFIDHLSSESFRGTIGFDSFGPTQTFAEDIDLSNIYGEFGLGSSTTAILTGNIFTGGSDYRFGNGGGTLYVASNLDAPVGVTVATAGLQTPTTVVLQGNNSYSGDGTWIYSGIVVFDGASALPSDSPVFLDQFVDEITEGWNFAYAGITENAGMTPNAFLTHLTLFATQSVLGLDSANPGDPRTVSDDIDLTSAVEGHSGLPVFIGTVTAVTLTGTLTSGPAALALTGIKGGELTVDSVLTDATSPSLIVGLAGVPEEIGGTVRLNGANTFSGGTNWQSGNLVLGNAGALGTGRLTISTDSEGALTYTGDFTVANDIVFDNNDDLFLGSATSLANLTLTGAMLGSSFDGFTYVGAGTLTYAGTKSELGWLTINAAPGGTVVYARPDALSRSTNLLTGALEIQADTGIMLLETILGTTVNIAAGQTLALLDNSYGEGPVAHYLAGDLTGAGALLVNGNGAALLGTNSYSGGTTLDDGSIGFTHSDALGTGQLTVTERGGSLVSLAPDLTLANSIHLLGELDVQGATAYGYFPYQEPGGRDFTLSGVISGEGSLWKRSLNTLTLAGDNTFSGGITIDQGTIVFAHDRAAGTGELKFISYGDDAVARFTTAAPVVGGFSSSSYNVSQVQLAAGSVLTINQAWDAFFWGNITGSGASLVKTGAGYLDLGGTGGYGYDGGTTITDGGIIFNADSLITAHNPGAIHVGAGAYAGLGSLPTIDFAGFLAKIDPLAQGTVGVDNYRTVTAPIDLSIHTSVRLGSSSWGTIQDTATITPAGNDYLFGGGGGTLVVQSTLTAAHGLDLTSPATQPLTLWLNNNNYFSGTMTVTNSAAIFGPLSISYVNNIEMGAGAYVGSSDPQLTPAQLLSHFAPGTGTGMIGFDEYGGYGRSVGGAIDLTGFGPGVFLGTATHATLRGPITLPGGVTTYNFGAYKGGFLTVESTLEGGYGVVIGDLYSFGTMRHPHYPSSKSTVYLSGSNTYTGGTVLNAGLLAVAANGLGSGTLTVQPNSFPATREAGLNLPQFEVWEAGAILPNAITLNGSLRIAGYLEATLAGTISGAGGLNFHRTDTAPLTLSGANTYEGGTVIEAGNVLFTTDSAFGPGTITTMPDGGLITGGGARTLANPIHISHDEGSAGYNGIRLGGHYDLTLTGPITFDSGVSYLRSGPTELGKLPLLRLEGGLGGESTVVFDTGGMVWISGINTYTGGTEVDSGRVIFDSVAAIPAVGSLNNYDRYIGLATPTLNLQADYIDRFNPNGYGRVIGFDSADPQSPNTFSSDINLTAFDGAYLSSATAATLTGTITTHEQDYRFSAAGGGVLTVASNLTGDRGVRVDGSGQPFLLQLAGTNTFGGEIQANGGGIIFMTQGSLPEIASIQPNSSTGSYFGIMDPDLSLGMLLSHFDSYTSHTVIGFDSADVNSPRTITSPDLSYFAQNPTDIYLGTATRAIIDGTITWPAFNRGYAFAAYRTGWLTVNAALDGGAGVIIGNPQQRWTVQEFNGALPTIELAGDNSYSGGTEFNGGQLVLSHANALGTGNLTVWDSTNADQPVQRLLLNTPTIANDITFANYTVNLEVATTQASAALTGDISGAGSLTKVGAGTINLGGANSFSGTITIEEGILQFDHASASGAVDNTLRFAEDGGIAHFTTGSPVIGHLQGEQGVTSVVDLDAGVNLTVGNHDQGSSSQYDDYYGSITGSGSLTKDGYATLTLHGASDYTGGTTITQGKLVADNATALGTGTVTLNGGDLGLGKGVTVNNAIVFGGSGGKLSGSTTFTAPVTLGAGGGISPGNSPGTMTFGSDLTLGSSSFLDFEIQDPTGAAGTGYDTVVVSGTLFVTSTPSTPFVINLLSLDGMGNSGQLQLSNPNTTYSLLVISAGAISGFDPSNFTLNTAGFSTNFGTDFQFNLFQSGNEIRLDFTAVPEPSTYALLGLGALLLGITRRRAARR